MIDVIINIGIPLCLIALGLIVGSMMERRHFASITTREEQLSAVALLTGKAFPLDRAVSDSRMVQGGVVVSIDYFKRLLAGLRMLFGGELRSYASLLDRARREAILRMKEQYPTADLIVNVRIETSSISKGGQDRVGSVEMIAYGTAIKFSKQPAS